jgi:hypothetical protein
MRITARRLKRWDRIPGLYDIRQCPWCCALVFEDIGQRGHQDWHDAAAPEPEPEWEDPGGYVIGSGPLPASVRGGEDTG